MSNLSDINTKTALLIANLRDQTDDIVGVVKARTDSDDVTPDELRLYSLLIMHIANQQQIIGSLGEQNMSMFDLLEKVEKIVDKKQE